MLLHIITLGNSESGKENVKRSTEIYTYGPDSNGTLGFIFQGNTVRINILKDTE